MAFSMKDGHDEDLVDINVVPLVDVMLVLLIIFMVTAPLSIGGIKVALPKTKAKTMSVPEERVVLSVSKKGRYFIEDSEVPRANLEQKMAAIFEFRKEKNLFIRADRGVQYGAVVDAMSAAKLSGVQKISMLTENQARR